MGLDTTHNCWHGPYSAFGRFRAAVGEAAKDVFGYVPDYGAHPARAFQGWWDDDHTYTDVLDVFFVHSDCDGYIFPQQAEPLAKRLRQLVEHVPDDDCPENPQFSTRARLTRFVFGLLDAVDTWQIVEFR